MLEKWDKLVTCDADLVFPLHFVCMADTVIVHGIAREIGISLGVFSFFSKKF